MNIIISYLKNSINEFKNHVEWPKWIDLYRSTIMITISTLLLSIFLLIIDFTFSNVIKIIYRNIFKLFNF